MKEVGNCKINNKGKDDDIYVKIINNITDDEKERGKGIKIKIEGRLC